MLQYSSAMQINIRVVFSIISTRHGKSYLHCTCNNQVLLKFNNVSCVQVQMFCTQILIFITNIYAMLHVCRVQKQIQHVWKILKILINLKQNTTE